MFKSEIFKNISILSSGTILAQTIPLLCAPIIARIFSAEDFGEFAAIMAILNILSVIINGRYELAVVLPSEDHKSRSVLIGSWIIGIIISVLFLFGSFPLFSFISSYFKVEFGFLESLYVSVSLFAIAIWQPLNYYFIRNKSYLKMTYNKFVKAIVTVSFTILIGYYLADYDVNGLTLGLVVGWIILAVFSFYQGPFSDIKSIRFAFKNVKASLTEYIDYPKFNAIPALMNSIASQIGVYVFVYFFSTEVAGHYTFSKQYLFVPMSILGLSLSQVFFQRITEKFNKSQSVFKELKMLFLFLVSASILICLVVIPFAGPIFDFVFGVKWKLSAEMSQIFILYFSLQFITSPLSTVLHALKCVKLASIFPLVYLLSMLSLFLVEKQSLEDFLPIYVLAESIPYIIYLVIIYTAIRRYERKLINI